MGPGTGSRRRGGWPPAGVSASRQPRCRLRDCPFWAGRATWWQLVIPGRQSQRWTTAWPPRPARDPAREGPPEPGLPDRSGPIVTTSSPPDRRRPPRLAAASPGGGTGPGGHAALAARGTGEGCGDDRGPPACGPHRACHEMLRADRPIRFSPGCGAGPAGPGGLRAVRRRLAARRPAMPSAACGMRHRQCPPGCLRCRGGGESVHAKQKTSHSPAPGRGDFETRDGERERPSVRGRRRSPRRWRGSASRLSKRHRAIRGRR